MEKPIKQKYEEPCTDVWGTKKEREREKKIGAKKEASYKMNKKKLTFLLSSRRQTVADQRTVLRMVSSGLQT